MHKILIYLHIVHLLKSSTCFEHYSAHLQEVSTDTQFNHIRRIYLKFNHYQFSLISNAANCNKVILDNSLFTE